MAVRISRSLWTSCFVTFLFACDGGGPFTAEQLGDGGAGDDVLEHDAGDVPDVLGPDVLEHDAGDVPDVLEHDAGDVPDVLEHDAGGAVDGGACTPLAFPLAAPPGCLQNYGPAIDSPGRVWVLQVEASPHTCRSYALAGSEACERCGEEYSCACLARLFVDAGDPWTRGTGGTGCVDGPAGPYWSQ